MIEAPLIGGARRPHRDGPDISHHQVGVDWAHVPDFDLWMIKATEGTGFVSPTAGEFWRQITRLSPRWRGVYHWIRATSDPIVQADHFLHTCAQLAIHADTPGVLFMLDWERTATDGTIATVEQVDAWIARVEKTVGADRVIVYASDWVDPDGTGPRPGFREWRARHPQRALWYANYSLGTKPTSGWPECEQYDATVWQWTSTAITPGFVSGIDMNHVRRPELLDRIALNIGAPSDPDQEGDTVFRGYCKHADHTAVYAYFSNGTKVWLSDGPTYDAHRFLLGAAGQVVPDVQTLEPAVLRALGPIVGPVPHKVDAYGVPSVAG